MNLLSLAGISTLASLHKREILALVELFLRLNLLLAPNIKAKATTDLIIGALATLSFFWFACDKICGWSRLILILGLSLPKELPRWAFLESILQKSVSCGDHSLSLLVKVLRIVIETDVTVGRILLLLASFSTVRILEVLHVLERVVNCRNDWRPRCHCSWVLWRQDVVLAWASSIICWSWSLIACRAVPLSALRRNLSAPLLVS